MARRSKYAPIWDKLKVEGKAEILANPADHFALIKAIKKRKDSDTGYKVLLSANEQTARLKFETEANKITVYLILSTGIDSII